MKHKTRQLLKSFLVVFLQIVRYTILFIMILSFIFLGLWMAIFAGGTEIEKLLKRFIDKLL